MMTMQEVVEDYFKGWAIPGIKPPGANDPKLSKKEEGETLDAISGHFRLFQLAKGHRFSTDDIITAWYGTSWCPSARTVLDLGSGIGSVGMVAAWRLPGARFVTVEAQEESVRLAHKSARYNGLVERYDIRQGDFRDPTLFAQNEKFDLVLGSPPYFPVGAGVLGDHPQKIACRFETRGDISDYCMTAAERLAHGGLFACVFPIQPEHQEQRVIDAARAANLVIVRRRAICLRAGDEPLLCLFAMMRENDLPEKYRQQTWIEPTLIIRDADGSIHPEYSAVKLAFGFPP